MNCIICPRFKECEAIIKVRRAAVLAAAQGEHPEEITRALNDALQWADEFLTTPTQFKFNTAEMNNNQFFRLLRKEEDRKKREAEEAQAKAKEGKSGKNHKQEPDFKTTFKRTQNDS